VEDYRESELGSINAAEWINKQEKAGNYVKQEGVSNGREKVERLRQVSKRSEMKLSRWQSRCLGNLTMVRKQDEKEGGSSVGICTGLSRPHHQQHQASIVSIPAN